jgi:16S rRNA (cytosine1402-N4)-methyltransferase
MHDAPLDMRMDTDAPLSAYEVVNEYSESELRRVIFEYGEERFAQRIARAIVTARSVAPIKTTGELSDLIKAQIPKAQRIEGPHPAKRTFQAIRIEVNRELDSIRPLIEAASNALVSGGRLAIISFHSLEDRIVKQAYKSLSSGCTCPKDFPICICGNKPTIKEITKKPTLPCDSELSENPRARSAKLRICEKL